MKVLKLTVIFLFCALCANAQRFYRPWQSYRAVKPQKSYKTVDYLMPSLRLIKCDVNGESYEPNEFLTKWNINDERTFQNFKNCCQTHPSRCVTNYIGSNDKTLLYTMVEKRAYRYMSWILNEGFVYDSYIDTWGVYKEVDGVMVPLRNYNPMMLACKMGDLRAAKILRERGAFLSRPENAIGLTPYDFAKKNAANFSAEFNNYIETEYQEEIKNISDKKEYGTTFSINILQDFIDDFNNNFLQNQQKIVEKVNLLNKI